MRIDDLDPPRVAPGATDDILKTLEACAMEWHGPVMYQSTREAAYRAALEDLRRMEKVYTCACSRREIADSGIAGIEGYVYPGTCRPGLPTGRTAHAWRVMTRAEPIVFDDAVQGRVEQSLEREIGDFVVQRADGVFAYQLAAAVDDAQQAITHVVRGADLLNSTSRQIYVQQLLGLRTPAYAHLPVAVNERGEKLSKQTYALPIDRMNPTAAMVQALHFLGQAPPAALTEGTPREVLLWAEHHWQLAFVPRVRSVAVPV